MSDEPIDTGRIYPICKFSEAGSEKVLRKTPATIEDWKENVSACMALVEKRLDAIERRVMEKKD